jgi:hypothetical protein
MNQAFSKLNLYDQIGYLLVGSIALLVIYFDFFILNISFSSFNLTTLPLWIVVGYFLGHIIQAIANVFIREEKENFSNREKELLNTARSYFNLEKFSDSEIWNLCYMLTSAKDITGQVKSFAPTIAHRLFIVLAMESLFIIYTIFSFSCQNSSINFEPSNNGFVLWETKKVFNYLQSKVLQTLL